MKIICIGRNYADHAKELNNAVPKEPVVFLKPDTAVIKNGDSFYLPSFSNDVHFEAELVVRINRMGKHIKPEFAHKYYKEITVGVDFTARDVQQELKSKGLPWEKAKAFDGSAAVGDFVDVQEMGYDVQDLHFTLLKNNQVMQKGHTANMMFSVDQIISYVSSFITLKVGDLVFTGTPAGVGKVEVGDELKLQLETDNLLKVVVK
jgi:acylpyruvate hydrolase